MTRLYLPSSGAPSISPSFDATSWGLTTEADRVRALRTPSGTPLTNKQITDSTPVASNILARQYVSDPLEAQTISGTVKGIIRTQESNAAANFRSQVRLWVVSGDGLTTRGDLRIVDGALLASEWDTTLTNRKYPLGWVSPGETISSVTCIDGDRLVLDVGLRAHQNTTTSYVGTLDLGDPTSGSDLAENETGTTSGRPWIEFSADLRWLHGPVEFLVSDHALVTTVFNGENGFVSGFNVVAGSGGADFDDIVIKCQSAGNAEETYTLAGDFTGLQNRVRTDEPLWITVN
jgi:hypothetical protein